MARTLLWTLVLLAAGYVAYVKLNLVPAPPTPDTATVAVPAPAPHTLTPAAPAPIVAGAAPLEDQPDHVTHLSMDDVDPEKTPKLK